MPEETPKPNQEISAGDGSHNYQAARDIHVHKADAAKPESPIIKPTIEAIKFYDPKTNKIMDAARREIRLDDFVLPSASYRRSPGFIWLLWAIVFVAITMYYIGWLKF